MDICTARQAAKQAERQREKRAYLNGLLRKRLSKLNEARYHSMFAPDNDDGRAMLTALLRFGLTAESAAVAAPWLEPDELTRLQRTARRLRWEQIGARIKLTEQERITHRLWQFRQREPYYSQLLAWAQHTQVEIRVGRPCIGLNADGTEDEVTRTHA